MHATVDDLLRELEARDRRERELGLPSEVRMRSITRDVGQFLYLLARAAGARRILEIGSGKGYSTIWLGLAAQAGGGHVLACEKEEHRAQEGRNNLAQAGLAETVTVRTGAAEDHLAEMSAGNGSLDFVFLDAEKQDYAAQFDLVAPLVRRAGLIVADNVTSHPEILAPYLRKIEAHPHFESVVVPVGRGEAVSLKVDQRLPAEILALFEELEAFAQDHRGMHNVPHDAGRFLHLLVRATRARHVLEIGTSNGYSGLWLATALQPTGGRLVTVERDSAKANLARRNFRRAGVSDVVDLKVGDAARVLDKAHGPFDLVFFDAGKQAQAGQLQTLLNRRQIRAGGLIISDNALTHPEALAPYHSFVRTHPLLESVMLPLGNGFEMSWLNSDGN